MKLSLMLAVCVALTAFTVVAQTIPTRPGNTQPVAFLYVSSQPGSSSQINAFTVAPNGALTAVTGSPFPGDVQVMTANSKYLFGSNFVDIFSFAIAPNGAVKQADSINAQSYNDSHCGGPVSLFLDRTGTTLYDLDFYGDICANNTYQSFNVDSATGELNYLGASAPGTEFASPLSFLVNNVDAYTSDCYKEYATISGFSRNSDGTLALLSIMPPVPDAEPGYYYCTNFAAADSANNVAVSMLPSDTYSSQPASYPTQLAVYSADDQGKLTTNSTLDNMPAIAVTYVTGMAASPAGNILAVSGTGGLQLFHFNGSNPITRMTGLLTSNQVDEIAWDNNNHLFAISQSAGLLYVYTVTSSTMRQAPGSPHAITNLKYLAVSVRE